MKQDEKFFSSFQTAVIRSVFSRFGIKVGIAAGTIYYLNEEGVFKHSDEAHKVYGKINNALQPYLEEVKKQLPIEVRYKGSFLYVFYIFRIDR